MNEKVTVGLYRHFKGNYYFVQNIIRNAVTNEMECYYFNVLQPELGFFTRPVSQWLDTETEKGAIHERLDNVTGQFTRFERVKSIDWQISSYSTDQLMWELQHRKDSPIYGLDVKGAESEVIRRDYVIGKPMYDEATGVQYFPGTINVFEDEKEARKALKKSKLGEALFKRTWIQCDYFDSHLF